MANCQTCSGSFVLFFFIIVILLLRWLVLLPLSLKHLSVTERSLQKNIVSINELIHQKWMESIGRYQIYSITNKDSTGDKTITWAPLLYYRKLCAFSLFRERVGICWISFTYLVVSPSIEANKWVGPEAVEAHGTQNYVSVVCLVVMGDPASYESPEGLDSGICSKSCRLLRLTTCTDTYIISHCYATYLKYLPSLG